MINKSPSCGVIKFNKNKRKCEWILEFMALFYDNFLFFGMDNFVTEIL